MHQVKVLNAHSGLQLIHYSGRERSFGRTLALELLLILDMTVMKLNLVILLCSCLFCGTVLFADADLPFVLEWEVGKTYWLDVRQEERKTYTPSSFEETTRRTLWELEVVQKNELHVVLHAKIARIRINKRYPESYDYFDSRYHKKKDLSPYWDDLINKQFVLTVDLAGRILRHQLLLNGKVVDSRTGFKNPLFLWQLKMPLPVTDDHPNDYDYTIPTFIGSPKYEGRKEDKYLIQHQYEHKQNLTLDRASKWFKHGVFEDTNKNVIRKIWIRGWSNPKATVKGQFTHLKIKGALKEKENLLRYLQYRFGVKASLKLSTDGSFEFSAPLSGLVSFDLFNVPLILSPGDYLEVRADLDSIEKTTIYKGNCMEENRLWHQLDFRDHHSDEDSKKFIAILNNNADVSMLHRDVRQDFLQDSVLLFSWKQKINPFHFWDFYWHYRYEEAYRMFIFSSGYHFTDMVKLEPTSFLPRFHSLPILNDWCEQGYEYSNFLQHRYMSYLAGALRKFNVYTSALPDEGVVPLAKYMLCAEPLERVLYNHLSDSFSAAQYDQTQLQAEARDFIQFCQNLVYKENIKKQLSTFQGLGTGQSLPDFEVYNLKGKKLNARKLRGKKTIFRVELGSRSFGYIEYAKLAKRHPSLNIVHIYPLPYQEFKQKFPGANTPPPYTEDNVFFPKNLKAAQAIHDQFCFNESSKWENAAYNRLFFVNEATEIADFMDNTTGDPRQLRADFAYRLQFFLAQKSALKPQYTWLYIILANLLLAGLVIALRTRYIRRREARKRRLTEMELKSLRAQLNPHFIFNTMSSIQHLIASRESEKANQYLADLAGLMRLVLRATQKGIISLREELDLLEQYCSLEKLRKPFDIQLEIDQSLDLNNCEVPALLLQPYVENAILHGLAPLQSEGKITLRLAKKGNTLHIEIQDNGVGLKQSRQKNSNGTQSGLLMNEERLRLMYGTEASVQVTDLSEKNNAESGTLVTLKLPCC